MITIATRNLTIERKDSAKMNTKKQENRAQDTVVSTGVCARIYRDGDADQDLLKGKRVATIGCGSQGHVHALNIQGSGVKLKQWAPGIAL